MQELPLIISLVALVVSACGLAVSALAYVRDRSRLVAWSSIVWHSTGSFHEPKDVPLLHILVLNTGRRPIMIQSLVKKSEREVWWANLKEPLSTVDLQKDLTAYLEERKRNAVAHVSSIRLNEGEIFEMVFQTDDCPNFIATHADQPDEAQSLFIKDVQGNEYRIRDSHQHLRTLFSAWRQIDT